MDHVINHHYGSLSGPKPLIGVDGPSKHHHVPQPHLFTTVKLSTTGQPWCVRPAHTLLPATASMRPDGHYLLDILTRFLASIGPPHCRPRASHARGTQEWRDAERPPRFLRYLDEPHPEGGGADQPCMSTQPPFFLSSAPRYSVPSQHLCAIAVSPLQRTMANLYATYRKATSFSGWQKYM